MHPFGQWELCQRETTQFRTKSSHSKFRSRLPWSPLVPPTPQPPTNPPTHQPLQPHQFTNSPTPHQPSPSPPPPSPRRHDEGDQHGDPRRGHRGGDHRAAGRGDQHHPSLAPGGASHIQKSRQKPGDQTGSTKWPEILGGAWTKNQKPPFTEGWVLPSGNSGTPPRKVDPVTSLQPRSFQSPAAPSPSGCSRPTCGPGQAGDTKWALFLFEGTFFWLC